MELAEDLFAYADGAHFSLAGIPNARAVDCNEDGSYTVNQHDKYGYNNSNSMWDHSPEIVLVGDSFVYGSCVSKEETIAGQLGVENHSILNLGWPSSGTLREYASMVEFLPAKGVKNVFWFFYENDVGELDWEVSQTNLPNYMKPGFTQNLIKNAPLVEKALKQDFEAKVNSILLEKNVGQSSLGTKGRSVGGDLFSSIPLSAVMDFLKHSVLKRPRITHNYSLYNVILRLAKERVEKSGAKLTVVFLPTISRYLSEGWSDSIVLPGFYVNLIEEKTSLFRVYQGLGIPVIDIDEVFRKNGNPLENYQFKGHSHFNAKGYKVVADQLRHFLLEAKK